jgi:hypothetical protein
MFTIAPQRTADSQGGLPGRRVLALLEPGASGAAAVRLARDLAEHERAMLTVVNVAPRAAAGARCGYSPDAYNGAVRDAVAQELEEARVRLGEVGTRSRFALLVEGKDLPLADWSALMGFDLALLPARRRPLRSPTHPAAAALRRAGAEVWIIDRRGRRLPLA